MTIRDAIRARRFSKWYVEGVKNGFCTRQFCQTHDAGPMTKAEEDAWDEGLDPCVHVVRLGEPSDWLQDGDW